MNLRDIVGNINEATARGLTPKRVVLSREHWTIVRWQLSSLKGLPLLPDHFDVLGVQVINGEE